MDFTKIIELDSLVDDKGMCKQLELIVTVVATEDDCYHDGFTLWDGDTEIKIELLSKEEQYKLDALAEELAYDKSGEAYRVYQELYGDMIYEQMKDEGFNGEDC